MSEAKSDFVKSILGRQIRVLISDGRIIEGEFSCIDKDLNIIVAAGLEFHGVDPNNGKVFACRPGRPAFLD